ncbi:uncharacterized protein BDZ99DRAFT_527605 [Mytilinidion resinicola]|uniref:Uncharacterized protein n=1 Tax=Mytilinidion resinicola TaxID=574789 RepID=A0A6A6Y2K3_9PEZI|nr:uncharacterized protein BDZ99DRAFT_527605 [Mytilinidion resinicola]KAF2802234.1 hypothetical protein BDZ99DRAFT_527605 [Mytilinidion resinicola]
MPPRLGHWAVAMSMSRRGSPFGTMFQNSRRWMSGSQCLPSVGVPMTQVAIMWENRPLKHAWLDSVSRLKLYVRGTCITTIADMFSPYFKYLSSQRLCPADELYRYINLDTHFRAINTKLGDGNVTREDLFRVIMANRASSRELEDLNCLREADMTELLEAYDQLESRKNHSRASPYNELLVSSFQHFAYFARGRKLFLAANQQLGLASDTMPGDQIFILRGCQTPAILRHVFGKEYRFVETCYLYGAMLRGMMTWD